MPASDPNELRRIRHEARNLLTSIRLAVQGLLQKEALSERGQQRLAIAESALNRMGELIEELDTFAKKVKSNEDP